MKRLLKWGCGGFVVLAIVGVVVVTMGGDNTETTGQKSASRSSAVGTARPIAPAYSAIMAEASDMTDAQRNAYLKTLTGASIANWSGAVCDVSETFGSYMVEVTIDQDNDALLCTTEVQWKVTEEQALEYSKDQAVTFSGVVESISEIVGVVRFTLTEIVVK